jgi:hypothetical protein
MAQTASGIRYPQGSDTVNIATDLQNIATDIDTQIAAQTFGITAPGDIPGYTGAVNSTIAAPNTPGLLLSADSTAASGISWKSPYPNMYFIASAIATSGTQPILSFTNIPQNFQSIKIYLYSAVNTSTESLNLISINGVTFQGSNSSWLNRFKEVGNGNGGSSSTMANSSLSDSGTFTIMDVIALSGRVAWAEFTIDSYADYIGMPMPYVIKSAGMGTTNGASNMKYESGYIYRGTTNTAAKQISALSFQWGSTNSFTNARLAAYMYGVK